MRLLAKILSSLLALAGLVYLYYSSEKQHQMLINKFGLMAPDPYFFFTVYERAVSLADNLAAHFDQALLIRPWLGRDRGTAEHNF